MRHDPAGAAVVIMLRSLKMHGMAQAASDLMEQGSPAFEAGRSRSLSTTQGGNCRTRGPVGRLSDQGGPFSGLQRPDRVRLCHQRGQRSARAPTASL